MNIYYQAGETNILMHLKPSDRWYLIADQDAGGSAHLYINVNGVEAPLLYSSDFRCANPDVDDDQVLELYNAMIHAVFQQLRSGGEYLDLAEIEEDLLPRFMDKWKVE